MDKSDAMTAEMKGTVFHRFIPPKYFAQKRALLIFAWKKKRLEIFTFQNLQWSLKSNFKSKKIYNRNYSWTVILNAVCLLCSPALRLLHLQGHKFSKTGRGKRLYTSALRDHQYHMYSNCGTMNPRYPPETMRITWIPPYVCAQTCWDLPRKSRSDALYSISNKYCCHVVIFAWNHFAKLLMNYTVVYITQTRCVPGTARYALQGRLYKML